MTTKSYSRDEICNFNPPRGEGTTKRLINFDQGLTDNMWFLKMYEIDLASLPIMF